MSFLSCWLVLSLCQLLFIINLSNHLSNYPLSLDSSYSVLFKGQHNFNPLKAQLWCQSSSQNSTMTLPHCWNVRISAQHDMEGPCLISRHFFLSFSSWSFTLHNFSCFPGLFSTLCTTPCVPVHLQLEFNYIVKMLLILFPFPRWKSL